METIEGAGLPGLLLNCLALKEREREREEREGERTVII